LTQSIDETLEQRGNRYGADVTQHLKQVIQRGKSWPDMTCAQRESLEMIAHKIGRIICGDPDYVDSWHDIAGYAKLVEDILNDESADNRRTEGSAERSDSELSRPT